MEEKEIREQFYARKKERIEKYTNELDITPLTYWIKKITKMDDLEFTVKRKMRNSEGAIYIDSQNLIDRLGIIGLAFKKYTISNFNTSVYTRTPDYDKIDYTKDYDLVFWISIHFEYEHIDGGTNGASIGDAWCVNGEWTFKLDKDRYLMREGN